MLWGWHTAHYVTCVNNCSICLINHQYNKLSYTLYIQLLAHHILSIYVNHLGLYSQVTDSNFNHINKLLLTLKNQSSTSIVNNYQTYFGNQHLSTSTYCVMYILNYNVKISSVTRQAIIIYVTLRHIHITTIAVEKQYYIFWVRVCSLHYSAWNAHVPYYIVICGLFGSTIFFHIIS